MGLRTIRIDVHRAAELIERFFLVPRLRQQDSEIRVGLGAAGVGSHCALERAPGAVPVTAVSEREPQVHPRLHVVGLEPHDLLVGGLGRRHVSLPPMVEPLEVPRLDVLGF